MAQAVVAIVTKGTKVLFIRRGSGVPFAGYWAPLSGKVEHGEDQASALVREVREEVGLTVKPIRKMWESVSTSGTHQLHWWLAEWVEGELTLDPREVSESRWLTLAEISGLEATFEKDREFFEQVLPSLGETWPSGWDATGHTTIPRAGKPGPSGACLPHRTQGAGSTESS